MVDTLTDADIAARMRAGRRCPVYRCRAHLPVVGARLCGDHRDDLARILDPAYLGDRDLERAASIPQLWARLDPAPGVGGEGHRRPPGFHSTPPLSLNKVVMRDRRSVAYQVVDVWFELVPGTNQINWDSPHYEDESPPRSVEAVVAGIVAAVREDLAEGDERALEGVAEQCGWLHNHLHLLVLRGDADELYADLKALHDQLRPAAGDPYPKSVADCGGSIPASDGSKVECGAKLYMPPPDPGVTTGLARPPRLDPSKPIIRCRRCGEPYTGMQLIRAKIGAERAS